MKLRACPVDRSRHPNGAIEEDDLLRTHINPRGISREVCGSRERMKVYMFFGTD